MNYLVQTDGYIVTTEHLDFKDPAGNFVDRIPDYDVYSKEVSSLNLKYNNRILKGLEIGWTKKDHEHYLDFLQNKYYDLVLLSVHQNGFFDYMDPRGFVDVDIESLITTYLDSLISALDHMHEHVNVLAHFDYGFRIHNIGVETLQTYGEDQLRELFQKLIENEIAFELNTSSMYRHHNLELYHYAIGLYCNLGGSLFTLGSDAHFAKDYCRNFDEAKKLLLKFGVSSVVCFIDRKPISVNLY